MDDFVKVQIIHPTCNPCGPIHKQPRGDFPPCSQDFIELSMCTVLHDNAVAWGLSANSPVKENTQLVRISRVKVPEHLSKVAIKGQESNLFTQPGKALLSALLPEQEGEGFLHTLDRRNLICHRSGFSSTSAPADCRVHSRHLMHRMQSAVLGQNGVDSFLFTRTCDSLRRMTTQFCPTDSLVPRF